MVLSCELSGESLVNSQETIVATPSGHLCIKRLLLQKLTENGGQDPFADHGRPLTEDQLIQIETPRIMPPKQQTFSASLKQLQEEYDNIALELFDTRKALEQTREELSQALYQQDAALRVIARLAKERDQAREALQTEGPVTAGTKKRKLQNNDEPTTSQGVLENDLPEQDSQVMLETWETLHKSRKSFVKSAAKEAPSKEDLSSYKGVDKKTFHKTNGIVSLIHNEGKLISAGKDKQIVIYDKNSDEILSKFAVSGIPVKVCANQDHVAVACASGNVEIYTLDGNHEGTFQATQTSLIDVRLHPDRQHVVATSESGRIVVGKVLQSQPIAVFQSPDEAKYTSGCLHPDGLIYVAGNTFGELEIWDFKSKTKAVSLKTDGADAVVCVDISNNGYHIAAAYASGLVRIWDLRKSSIIETINDGEDKVATVLAVKFDPSGKYLAYSGEGGSRIVAAKEWNTLIARLEATQASGLAWGDKWIAKCSTKKKEIAFYSAGN